MLFFLRAWRLGSKSANPIDDEADDLIFQFGVNAYAEACRQRMQANDLSAERHWSAVQSEIRRRILEVCSDPIATGRSSLLDLDGPGYAILDPAAQIRAESRRLAETIGTARSELEHRPPEAPGGGGPASLVAMDARQLFRHRPALTQVPPCTA
jgi:hypothetical protein